MPGAGANRVPLHGTATSNQESWPIADGVQTSLRELTDNAISALQRNDDEGTKVFALADARKSNIGQKLIPYLTRKLREKQLGGRLRQLVRY